MTTAIISYKFSGKIDIENLSTGEVDATLYKFISQNIKSAELTAACEYRAIDNLPDYIEFPDKPKQEIIIEIITDIDTHVLKDAMSNPAAVTEFLQKQITPENLIYQDHYMHGNDTYYITKVVHLDETHI